MEERKGHTIAAIPPSVPLPSVNVLDWSFPEHSPLLMYFKAINRFQEHAVTAKTIGFESSSRRQRMFHVGTLGVDVFACATAFSMNVGIYAVTERERRIAGISTERAGVQWKWKPTS